MQKKKKKMKKIDHYWWAERPMSCLGAPEPKFLPLRNCHVSDSIEKNSTPTVSTSSPSPSLFMLKVSEKKTTQLHVEPRAIFQTWKTGQGNEIFVCGFLRGMGFALLLRNGKFWRDWVMD